MQYDYDIYKNHAREVGAYILLILASPTNLKEK